jgi:putative tryptophan/tyrosine transport system substrate-binding protein
MRRIGLAVIVIVSLTLAPLAAGAQLATKVPRVGFLITGSSQGVQPLLDAFRQGLRELGYVEGQSIAIEYRWAEGKYERLSDLAAELVRLKLDVIVAVATPAVQAAKQATKAIPIVMLSVGDPVASGFVASVARPGGNITGLANIAPDLVGKQLQLLREVVPTFSLVAVLWNPANPSNASQLREAETAARALGVRVQPLEAQGPSDIDRAFAAMTRERAGALLVLSDSMLIVQRERIADLAAKSRLPAMYGLRLHAEAGGLMAYGANLLDLVRLTATYVDKILKGAKPADLPIEQPTKFELVINLKTAKALGIDVPPMLVALADEVIE